MPEKRSKKKATGSKSPEAKLRVRLSTKARVDLDGRHGGEMHSAGGRRKAAENLQEKTIVAGERQIGLVSQLDTQEREIG